MTRRIVLAAAIVAGVASVGCSRASDESETKQWAEPPPATKDVPVPTAVSIEVKVDGVTRPAITTDTLRAAKPDFADDERKAWLVTTLVPDASPPGTTVEAVSLAGVSVKFVHPTADGLEPVLFLTRRGELVVSAVDPKVPFPRYHGQGGRLHRAGDSMPRVTAVARVEITHTRP